MLILVRLRARTAAPARDDRHVRRRLDGRHVGRRCSRCENADVKAVTAELDKAIGDRNTGPLAGILRIIPIERLNAFLIITPQPAYLDEAKKWVDAPRSAGGMATARASTCTTCRTRAPRSSRRCCSRRSPAARGAGDRRRADGRARHARGHDRESAAVPGAARGHPAAGGDPGPATACDAGRRTHGARRAPGEAPASCATSRSSPTRTTTHAADRRHAAEYAVIEAAVKKMDVPSRQVMIEVTIAERDARRHARVRRRVAVQGRRAVRARHAAACSRVRHACQSRPCRRHASSRLDRHSGARARARASSTSSTTRTSRAASRPCCTCSTPTATRRSSPIRTSARSTTRRRRSRPATGFRSASRPLVGGTTNGFIDDDVAVHRHRRAAAGDAAHQRRRAGHARRAGRGQHSGHAADSCHGDAPPINTRSVQIDRRACQSGQTMVMGGLITAKRSRTRPKGLPLLSRIPIIGGLFGNQDAQQQPHRARRCSSRRASSRTKSTSAT